MPKVLGIDLGTTNSVMCVIEGGEPVIIESSEGLRLIPSVVAINPKSEERYVGQLAKRQATTNPENTIYSIKRFMGRKFQDQDIQRELKTVPYKVVAAPNGDAHVFMDGKTYSPPEISAMVLQKMKIDAEAKLGDKILQAVITVPAYYNDAQRQATKDAGKIAGLDVLRIINEPTASTLAYGLGKKVDETVAVFDLGGGTFDISLLRLGEGVYEVLSTNGDTHLGGDDWDHRIIDWLATEFKRESGIDLMNDRMALQRLKEAAEKAKIELSSVVQTEINLPFITADASGPKHLLLTLTRANLEQLCADLVERTESPCRQALDDAKIGKQQIDHVILVGGMTRMPSVSTKVREFFEKEPHKGVNPDEVVAEGAAIQAGVLQGDVREILLLDVTPLTLGIETLGGIMTSLITRNTTIPTSKSETFTTAADMQSSVEIHVLQGERPTAKDNKSTTRFILDGLLPSPRGIPQVEVNFDIDANGILSVRATDKGTGREQRVVIQPSSGISQQEIDKMVREGEEFVEQDRLRKEEIELKNQADSAVYAAEKLLRENAERISADIKSEVEEKIGVVRSALQGSDIGALRSALADLSTSIQKIGQAVYGQGASPGPEGPGPEPPGSAGGEPGTEPPPGTVEGEFREL